MTPDEIDGWLIAAIQEHGGDMSVIKSQAETAGINWRRVERSKTRLGITTERSGFGEVKTTWTLPRDLAATLAATNGDDGNSGHDGTDATVTDRDDLGSLAPIGAALELLGGVVDAARSMLAKFAAGRLPRQQINDLKWTVASAQRGLDTMARSGITLDSLRGMVSAEMSTAASVFWYTECKPFADRVARGFGFDPDADDVRDVLAWAISGEGPQPVIPERPEPRLALPSGYERCHIGSPGTAGHGFCARWPECSTDVNGNYIQTPDKPDCDYPACKPPPCTKTGDHHHPRDERYIPPGYEPAGGWVRRGDIT